jgi:hypothetical protein
LISTLWVISDVDGLEVATSHSNDATAAEQPVLIVGHRSAILHPSRFLNRFVVTRVGYTDDFIAPDENAHEIRDLILSHLRKTRTTGLGDEVPSTAVDRENPKWSAEQLTILRDIRGSYGM